MENEFDYTFDNEYTITLQGYDVSIMPSEYGEGYFHVTVAEEGAEVYINDIPAPMQQENLDNELIMQNVAQAAIDFFESSRDTLGEGAGAKMSSQKKEAHFYGLGICEFRKEWFQSLKGTPSEDMAYELLNSYIDLDYELSNKASVTSELYDQKRDIEYKLSKLELEHLKNSKPGREIIILTAHLRNVKSCSDAQLLKEFLDQFIGSPLEPEVMILVNELLSVDEQITIAEKNEEPNWDQLRELDQQMDSLAMDQFHRDLEECLPSSGAGAFPNMAGEVAELMQGVEMDAPLDPMMATDPFMPFASKKKSKMEGEDETKDEVYEEWKPVDERIHECGEAHQGLDPAERGEGPFQLGDRVTLSKEFETSGPLTGIHFEFPKGTKGVIDGLHDDHGNCYDVCLEDGRLVKIPADYLSK